MSYSEAFSEVNEDMVQILLMLEVPLTHDSKVEELFYGAPSSSEPSGSSAVMSVGWDLRLFKMTYSMTLLE